MGQSIGRSGLSLAGAGRGGQSIDHSRLPLAGLDGVAKLLTLFYPLVESNCGLTIDHRFVAKVLTTLDCHWLRSTKVVKVLTTLICHWSEWP
jgi:hypothetical protein